MRSPIEIEHGIDPVVSMMADRSGLWDITSERVDLLRQHQNFVSSARKDALDEMLEIASRGENFWEFKAEYFALLEEVKRFRQQPSINEVQEVLTLVKESSRQDRVAEREWVKRAVNLLSRLAEGD